MIVKNFFHKNFTVSIIILLSLVIIESNFFRFFQNKTLYQFVPWLSNYQGGFTRRGLPGEFLLQISELLNIHLGWIAFIFVSILYILFYFSFLILIKNLNLNNLFLFAIFSPLAFYFPVLNSKASGHKDIIFLCLLTIFCIFVSKFKKNHANYFMIFSAAFIILSHEGLVFYLTYLIIPFIAFFKFDDYKKLLFNLFPLAIVVLFATALIHFFNGSAQHVEKICESIKFYSDPGCTIAGQISFLKNTIKYNISSRNAVEVLGVLAYSKYFIIYSIGFIYGFIPLIILYWRSKMSSSIAGKKIHPLIFLILPLVASLPIYYMAADWGRYLYISYMSSLIILFFSLNNGIFIIKKNKDFFKDSKLKNFLTVLLLTIYCLGWTVPICCETNFKSGIYSSVKKVIYYSNK